MAEGGAAGTMDTLSNFKTFEFWKETASELYDHIDAVRNQRDGLVLEVEMLAGEFTSTRAPSIFKKLRDAGERLRALHIHYMAVSTNVCKRDRSQRQKDEQVLMKEYLETYNVPFHLIANAEKWQDQKEAEDTAAAEHARALIVPQVAAAAAAGVIKSTTKLNVELRPDLAHSLLSALEFEEWKRAAQIWAEVSGFKSHHRKNIHGLPGHHSRATAVGEGEARAR
jgi:hypothetical protein